MDTFFYLLSTWFYFDELLVMLMPWTVTCLGMASSASRCQVTTELVTDDAGQVQDLLFSLGRQLSGSVIIRNFQSNTLSASVEEMGRSAIKRRPSLRDVYSTEGPPLRYLWSPRPIWQSCARKLYHVWWACHRQSGSLRQSLIIKEALPLSHEVQTGPPCFLKSLSEEPGCGWIQS